MSPNSDSASGIHVNKDGSRYVGGSVRPDGSIRRVRRVKEGYTPLEDKKKYVVPARRDRAREENDKNKTDSGEDGGTKIAEKSRKEGIKDNDTQTADVDKSENQLSDMLGRLELKEETRKYKTEVKLNETGENTSAKTSDIEKDIKSTGDNFEKSSSLESKPSTPSVAKYVPPSRRKQPN